VIQDCREDEAGIRVVVDHEHGLLLRCHASSRAGASRSASINADVEEMSRVQTIQVSAAVARGNVAPGSRK
jgi:hypothetical protein